MKKFVIVWCFAILFNQALTNPIIYGFHEDVDPLPPNEISEDDDLIYIGQDGIYEINSDILSSYDNENSRYEDYDASTLETERFLDALELNAKINSGDIMSEYYSGKPQPEVGVEFANEYTTDDMPGTEPFQFEETKNYLKYLQAIEKDSKERRQTAIFNNILDQELEEARAGRYKRSTAAVNKLAKLLNDAGKSKLHHNSIKMSQSIPSNSMIKMINHLKNIKLSKNLNKPSKGNSAVNKMGNLLHDVTNSQLRNSERRSKRSVSVDKKVNLIDDISLKLRENSNKRFKRSLSMVDKIAKLVDDVNLQLRENSNKRSKRSLSSVDKVAKLMDDVNFQLRENSNKRSKRSLSSVDKVVKLVDDVNLKLRENSEKRFKRSLSSVDKVKKLISDMGKRPLKQNLQKGVVLKNGADCNRGRQPNPDGEGSGDGPSPSPNPDAEDATNLRLTNVKKFNKRKQKKAEV